MDVRMSFHTILLLPLMGALLMSCASMQSYNYEVISSTAVKGVPLEMVRRTAMNEAGQPASELEPDYGILDPSNAYHRCAPQCTDEEFEQAAVRYEAESKEREGGGDGGGGGGGNGM